MSENENNKTDVELDEVEARAEKLMPPVITFRGFLEKSPSNEKYRISDLISKIVVGVTIVSREFNVPPIELFCNTDSCNGVRTFDCLTEDNEVEYDSTSSDLFLLYECRNCKQDFKRFALRATYAKNGIIGTLVKYGELPIFGLPEPTRLTKLIKDPYDLELLNKGLDCDNQGKGIGAFTYYRRMVDSVKNQLIDEIAKAVEKINPEHEMLKHLEEAKKETRFKQAIEKIKDTLPKELYIDGINPLTALYSALSVGVHELTDGECQDNAHDIRLVLTELFEKTHSFMTEKKTISEALKRLIKK